MYYTCVVTYGLHSPPSPLPRAGWRSGSCECLWGSVGRPQYWNGRLACALRYCVRQTETSSSSTKLICLSVKLGVYTAGRSVGERSADVPLGALPAVEEELGPGASRILLDAEAADDAGFDAVAAAAEAEAAGRLM